MTADEATWHALLPPLLAAIGIVDPDRFEVHALTGGVSSDIVRVHLASGRDLCAKRALARLKVADDWRVPVERNRYEIDWLRRANEIVPGATPRVLGEDRKNGVALMEFLPPRSYFLWKHALLAGDVDIDIATSVARIIGSIHGATLNDADTAARFATDAMFDALRLDPYLRATAGRNPDLAAQILARLADTRDNKLALVHGDLSPKNILVSRQDRHVVILDAECAWFGDPVFDAAFCLNHLILKAIHMPVASPALLASARAFFAAWLACFPHGVAVGLAARTARLLPCLMLARIDGKSPVEYLSLDGRAAVRALATPLIADPPETLDSILARVASLTPTVED